MYYLAEWVKLTVSTLPHLLKSLVGSIFVALGIRLALTSKSRQILRSVSLLRGSREGARSAFVVDFLNGLTEDFRL